MKKIKNFLIVLGFTLLGAIIGSTIGYWIRTELADKLNPPCTGMCIDVYVSPPIWPPILCTSILALAGLILGLLFIKKYHK